MKKLALILGLAMFVGIVVDAQQQRGSTQMKDTTHMKGTKSGQKKSGNSYQMNRGTKQGTAKSSARKRSSMEQMEDTSKVKSKGRPVYR